MYLIATYTLIPIYYIGKGVYTIYVTTTIYRTMVFYFFSPARIYRKMPIYADTYIYLIVIYTLMPIYADAYIYAMIPSTIYTPIPIYLI